MHRELVESGKAPPFQRALVELQRFDGCPPPSEKSLWRMSVEAMDVTREVLQSQAAWIREYSLAPSSRDLALLPEKMHHHPSLSFHPEAIAMALSGQTWSQFVAVDSSLPVALGNMREEMLVRYVDLTTEILSTLSLVCQAALEAGVVFPENMETSLLEPLSAMYPPLGETARSIDELPGEYIQAIAEEMDMRGLAPKDS